MTNENMTTATTGTTEPKKTYRTFEIMQYEYNPKTGEDLHFNRAVIMKQRALTIFPNGSAEFPPI